MTEDRYMIIHDWVRFGQQIEAWSRGTIQPPDTIAGLKTQLPNDVLEIGPGYADDSKVHYCRPPATSQQVSFVIPHKDDIEDGVPSGSYPLPSFYSTMAFGDAAPVIADRDAFRSCRIADYSGNKCM